MLEIIDREDLPLFTRHTLNDPKYNITEKQGYMMLHALGADSKAERKYRNWKYYHSYRNYYDAGGDDKAAWDDLVNKGLAYKEDFYHITRDGLWLLSHLTQCTIYSNRQNVADCKSAAIVFFIREELTPCHGCWLPHTTEQLAADLLIPMKLARDTIHKLEADGLIEKGHYGEIDSDGYVHCQHGYYTTEKVKSLQVYELIKEDVNREVNRRLKH